MNEEEDEEVDNITKGRAAGGKLSWRRKKNLDFFNCHSFTSCPRKLLPLTHTQQSINSIQSIQSINFEKVLSNILSTSTQRRSVVVTSEVNLVARRAMSVLAVGCWSCWHCWHLYSLSLSLSPSLHFTFTFTVCHGFIVRGVQFELVIGDSRTACCLVHCQRPFISPYNTSCEYIHHWLSA